MRTSKAERTVDWICLVVLVLALSPMVGCMVKALIAAIGGKTEF